MTRLPTEEPNGARDELARHQADSTASNLGSLALLCRARFIRAADLVGMRSDAIEHLRHFGISASIDLSPLVLAWGKLCARYLDERYEAQINLFPGQKRSPLDAWGRFVHQELFSVLVREDEVVRNVLRALGGLSCTSPHEAANALYLYFAEMTLPDSPAPYAPEEDIPTWM